MRCVDATPNYTQKLALPIKILMSISSCE